MISFLQLWIFALAPLPWLLGRWRPPAMDQGEAALRVPFYAALETLVANSGSRTSGHRGAWLWWLVWLLLLTAASQPQWLDDDHPLPTTGRDLMLLIDISGSMRRMDFSVAGEPVDRLSVVKTVAGRFVEGRAGDRLGLVLFGASPYLRAPLSHDHLAIRSLLDEAEIALAGEYTAIGDAIGLALKRMRDLPSDSRVIVLLTDGANNEGRIHPLQAARLAAQLGVRIYTIGVGAVDSPGPNPYGVWSTVGADRFEREMLEDIAGLTGGWFFHVLDTEGLAAAYERLDELEPALGAEVREYLAVHLYPWPLGAALLLSLWPLLPRRRSFGGGAP